MTFAQLTANPSTQFKCGHARTDENTLIHDSHSGLFRRCRKCHMARLKYFLQSKPPKSRKFFAVWNESQWRVSYRQTYMRYMRLCARLARESYLRRNPFVVML